MTNSDNYNNKTYQSAMSVSMSYLTYRSRTVQDIRDHLIRKDFDHETIDQVIHKLKNLGLLDDTTFAKQFLQTKLFQSNNPDGPMKISYQLRQRGIPEEIITDILTEINFEDEYQAAEKLFYKKYSPENFQGYKDKYKAATYLKRKGFSQEVISKLLDMY